MKRLTVQSNPPLLGLHDEAHRTIRDMPLPFLHGRSTTFPSPQRVRFAMLFHIPLTQPKFETRSHIGALAIAACWVIALNCTNVTSLGQQPTPPAVEIPKATRELPAHARPESQRLPGLQMNGTTLLPNGWSLQPQGRQVPMGEFPVHMAIHPDGKQLAVIHSGNSEHEIITLELPSLNRIGRFPIPQTFYGLTFNQTGDHLLASGGEDELVYVFPFNEGYLGKPRTIRIANKKDKFVVSGLSLSTDDQQLFVCGLLSNTLKVIQSPMDPKSLLGQAKNETEKNADLSKLDIVATATTIQLPVESYPYTSLYDSVTQRLFVSLWGRAEVAVIDTRELKIITTWKTRSHPTEMLMLEDSKRIAVACSDDNSVVIIDTENGQTQEVLRTSLFAQAKNGSTPAAIGLSPDKHVLVAANADNNNIALFDVSEPRKSKSLGFIPVGWYPTNALFTKDGEQILVTNGKGQSSKDNRLGPNPINSSPRTITEYIGSLMQGTLSSIPSPSPEDMIRMTKLAYQLSPLKNESVVRTEDRSPNNPIPGTVGDKSPIEHCFYIIKENRTYDQVFGDVPRGNGDPSLCIFGEDVTPNHHALANQFVLLDNTYVESEVSADGHEWTMAAYATDFVEKTWPLVYGKSRGKLTYPAEGATKIGQPSSGYIWGQCAKAGKSYFSFGEFIANGAKAGEPSRAKIPILEGHFDPAYHSYDLEYSDLDRAKSFIARLKQFETEDNLPNFISIHLPNDHTSGTRVGKLTPTAMVAQNDAALGMIIEAISQSKYWHKSAVFVVQDDAQNGSDHVDAHRSVALAISPYIRRGTVDSTMYSTSSMLRTMELCLGLEPMTQFDASARPLYAAFQESPDLTPYIAIPPRVDINATNNALAWGADLSEEMDFESPDAADDLLLNEIVWRSVRGKDSPMPAPVRAAFVFVSDDDDDEEEGEDEDDEDDEDEDDEEDDDVSQLERPKSQRIETKHLQKTERK